MIDVNSVLYVLVVDDTVVYRRILQSVVSEIENAKVVGVAANGRIALERLEQLDVDVILLDVEMPEMDGIETLKLVRQRWPGIGVVLLSGADRRAADLTLRALELGALDFVPKADTGDLQRNQRQLVAQLGAIFRSFELQRTLGRPIGRNSAVAMDMEQIAKRASVKTAASSADESDRLRKLLPELRSGNDSGVAQRRFSSKHPSARAEPDQQVRSLRPSTRPIGPIPEALLIGCSTGGPQALAKIIPLLPSDLGVPVLVVQHMPRHFTASLAESLNRMSSLCVCEASDGQVVEANWVLIAPGGRHMTLRGERKGTRRIALNDDPPANSCKPSVDVLFRSAVPIYAGATLSVILTGMGEDGLEGVRALRAVGGHTLSQSEDSCVVYGMPRAIDLAGCSDESVPLESMVPKIAKWLRHRSVVGVVR